MSTFKSIATIKQETEKKRYYRAFDYARRVALTRFVELLENERQDFKLVTASPTIAHNRTLDQEGMMASAEFVIGNWVKFEVNDTQFYIQIDDNPFFDSYICASILDHEKKTKKSTGMGVINKTLYANIESYGASEENINQFVENLKQIFSSIQLTHWRSDRYSTPFDYDKQTIYTH
jgi:hypothetical protein